MVDYYFCLDIGESFTKIADVKKTGNLLEVVNIGYIESDPNFYPTEGEKVIENQTNTIKKLLTSLKITKKNVNIIIPDALSYSQILEMPRLNEKELISAIKYQADQFIPMPIEEANIDIEILSDNEETKKLLVLMIAAPKKIVEKIQGAVEGAGLIPDAIENELSATARFLSEFYSQIYRNKTDASVIVNLSLNSCSLYFFDSKSQLVLINHTFPIGYRLFLKEIQVNLNIDEKKAIEVLKAYNNSIANIEEPILKEFQFEIKRFINLIADKYHYTVNRVCLINEAVRFPALASIISAELLNPRSLFQNSPLTETLGSDLSMFITTIGGNLR